VVSGAGSKILHVARRFEGKVPELVGIGGELEQSAEDDVEERATANRKPSASSQGEDDCTRRYRCGNNG